MKSRRSTNRTISRIPASPPTSTTLAASATKPQSNTLPVRRGHRRTGLFPDLFDFEAPHPPPASMLLDGPDEGGFRARRDLGRGQARPEHGETSGCRDGLPLHSPTISGNTP